jgi:UDP-N-acetylglucosamine diphosphorylase/glucosamine-1-phosphate N-acetyltransferase
LILNDSRIAICETSLRENFYPLTYFRPAADLFFGTQTLLSKIQNKIDTPVTDIFVPAYLKGRAREIHPKIAVNEHIPRKCVVINPLTLLNEEIWSFFQNALKEHGQFLVIDSSGNLVFGRLDEADPNLLGKSIKARRGIKIIQIPEKLDSECLIRYPWDLVSRNSSEIMSNVSQKKDFRRGAPSCEVRGKNFSISETADIERFVTIDTRSGPVIVDDQVEIQSFSHLTGPCFIGKKTKVKSAKIRSGTSVGENCRVSGEIEATIFSEFSNKSHDGFLGHSLVGSWVNLGALTSNSDLKNTYGKIKADLGQKVVETGLIKVGVTIGDMAKTAIGTLVMSGKIIGTGAHVFGVVLENAPSFTMYAKSYGAKSAEIEEDSAIATQKRMMERRGLTMSAEMQSLIRSVYKMTKGERAIQRVVKRRFNLS